MERTGLEALLVYADREHAANISFLSDFDPRFEEALMVIRLDGSPALLAGNECVGYAGISKIKLEVVLCQSFSLPGQDRSKQPSLVVALRKAGLRAGDAAGLVGWKVFTTAEVDEPTTAFDTPTFIVEGIRSVLGDRGSLVNATYLFIDPAEGLRTTWEVDQLAAFEFETAHASAGMLNAIEGLVVGETEMDVVRRFGFRGQPLSYHLIVNSGPRTQFLLSSPSTRRLEVGDPVFMANGGRGANTVRAGFVVESVDQLSEKTADYVAQVVYPYAAMVRAWYETVGIGVRAGTVVERCLAACSGKVIGSALNPGHLIHIEEWSHSPFVQGSSVELRSGMGIQMDIIPITSDGSFISDMEDGIVLADPAYRAELRSRYPAVWERIQSRRQTVQELLAVELSPDVLPLSNIQGWLAPLLLDSGQAVHLEV
jgi:hypothetical protein